MNKKKEKQVVLFENREVRRTWHDEQWYFAVEDVANVLVHSRNIKDYLNKLRKRDPELDKGYGQFVHTLGVKTTGGVQKMNCSSIQGIFRIIQSIPSPKAEPFKRWLAKVGQERIEEIQDPERAIVRAKKIYEQKGYDDEWIAKRMRGINVRNTLTDEWKKRGAKEGIDFAILTNEIYNGTFNLTAREIKNYKNLDHSDNLRDHMEELELILTMLGEATTTKISQTKSSEGLKELKTDARKGGAIAGLARKNIEKETKQRILSKGNFFNHGNKKLK